MPPTLTSPSLGADASERGRTLAGVYPALVTDVDDPDGQGRVRVRFPWRPDPDGADATIWARLATLMAGPDRGTWFVPDVDDEVLVAFEAGDPRRPYVIGALWNGRDDPPVRMDGGGRNNVKAIVSRRDIRITLDDTDGGVTLRLETPGGQSVELTDTPGAIVIQDNNGNTVKLEAQGITVTASAKVTVNAATAEISAGLVDVKAGMSKFSGVVQCSTLITNSVVSASYTPGAGNVW